MNVNVNIERLILDGVRLSPRDREQMTEAVEHELRRLLQPDALNSNAQAVERQPPPTPGPIPLPDRVGGALAAAVHRALTPTLGRGGSRR
jgi:hypothetical protein